MYDAVQLFAKALDDLDRSRHIDVTPLECDGDSTWVHGNSLVNYMKWVSITYAFVNFASCEIESYSISVMFKVCGNLIT